MIHLDDNHKPACGRMEKGDELSRIYDTVTCDHCPKTNAWKGQGGYSPKFEVEGRK